MLLLSFSAKEGNQRKLPAAPASLNVSALTSGVVAEPDDADLGQLTEGLCFAVTFCSTTYHFNRRQKSSSTCIYALLIAEDFSLRSK
jgi:hypothetical protein